MANEKRNNGKAMRPFKAKMIEGFEKSTQFELRFVGSKFPRKYKLPNKLTGHVLEAGGWKPISDMSDEEKNALIEAGEQTYCLQSWLIEKEGIQTSSLKTIKDAGEK